MELETYRHLFIYVGGLSNLVIRHRGEFRNALEERLFFDDDEFRFDFYQLNCSGGPLRVYEGPDQAGPTLQTFLETRMDVNDRFIALPYGARLFYVNTELHPEVLGWSNLKILYHLYQFNLMHPDSDMFDGVMQRYGEDVQEHLRNMAVSPTVTFHHVTQAEPVCIDTSEVCYLRYVCTGYVYDDAKVESVLARCKGIRVPYSYKTLHGQFMQDKSNRTAMEQAIEMDDAYYAMHVLYATGADAVNLSNIAVGSKVYALFSSFGLLTSPTTTGPLR